MVTTSKAKKGSVTGWILFLVTLLVFSFAATPGFEKYSVLADRGLIALRLSVVLALSIVAIRNWMLSGPDSYKDTPLLQRLRGWYYDADGTNSDGR